MSNYFENNGWKKDRLGKFTASEIWKILKPGRKKGEVFGQTALNYINEVIAEIITGEGAPEVTTKAMEWGHANEQDAVLLLEKHLGKPITYLGGADPKFYPFNAFSGGSPDGIGDDFVVEIKCPFNSANHVEFLKGSRLDDVSTWLQEDHLDYYAQLQFNMMCTDKELGYLVSYDPRVIDPEFRLAVMEVRLSGLMCNDIVERLTLAKGIVSETLGLFEKVA